MKNQFSVDDCVELTQDIEIGIDSTSGNNVDNAGIFLKSGTKGMIDGNRRRGYFWPVRIASVTYLIHEKALFLYRKSWWSETNQDPQPEN